MKRMPFRERLALMAATRGTSECWDWPGCTSNGYGRVIVAADVRGLRSWYAHRAAYTVLVGPVPDGTSLDHLCRNRRCVNPQHLEPVTQRENVLRGDTIPAKNAGKTHCDYGHPYTAENTYFLKHPKYGTMMRYCRMCQARKAKAAYARRGKTPLGKATCCRRGHPYTAESLYIRPDGNRRCRICDRQTYRDWLKERASQAS